MSIGLFNQIGETLSKTHETESGQMFGKACLKTNKKAFAAFFKEDMVFKLGRKEVETLKEKYEGAVSWDPSGKNRPMKDWLQVPAEYSNDWELLAKKALEVVIKQET